MQGVNLQAVECCFEVCKHAEKVKMTGWATARNREPSTTLLFRTATGEEKQNTEVAKSSVSLATAHFVGCCASRRNAKQRAVVLSRNCKYRGRAQALCGGTAAVQQQPLEILASN